MPYRPHLVSSTTRPIVRSLVQKVFGDFDPLRLDPYLFFDAATSMVGTLENPTLDLDPSKPDTLDVITATRAGTATFTNANGLIASASPNTVRVDQTQGAELTPTVYQNIGYTDFSSGWTAEGGTLTDSQTQAPDGTTPVYELTENTGTSRHRLFDSGIPLVAGQDYTVSAYVKKVSSGRFFLINSSALNGIKGFLNLDTGVATLTSGTGTIAVTNEGDDWYRLSVTAQATTTNGFVYMQLQNAETDVNYTGTGASMLIWGPQFEEGTTASDFVANTSGNPKFITGATYGPRVPMILVEPSSVNLIPYSEDFSNSAWSKSNTTVTSNESTSPDGLNNASLVTVNSASISHLRDFFPISAAAHTFSIYAKAGTTTDIQLYVIEQGVGSGTADVDIQSGVVTNVSSEWNGGVTTENIGNGWFRIRGTRTFTTSASNHGIGVAATGQNGLNFYIWGAQVETGSLTSYIPTAGSTVTRAKDDLVISGSAFSSFYNQSEGTFYVEYVMGAATGQQFIFEADNGNNNRILIYNDAGNNIVQYIAANGSNTVSDTIGTRSPVGQLSRVALSYATNNVKGSHNGGTAVTDTSANIPTTINRLNIGSRFEQQDAPKLNGRIRRMIFWPYSSENL